MSGKQAKRARQAMRAAGLTPHCDQMRQESTARYQAEVDREAAIARWKAEDPEGFAREQARTQAEFRAGLLMIRASIAAMGGYYR